MPCKFEQASLSSAGRLCIGFLSMVESSLHSLHVWNFAREDNLLNISPLLHVLLILNSLNHSDHQLLQIFLLLGHVLRRLHHLDSVDPGVDHIKRMVESCLSSSPIVHMSQSNSMPVVGLCDRPGTSRKGCNPLRETILEVGNGLLVVVTLHAYLS